MVVKSISMVRSGGKGRGRRKLVAPVARVGNFVLPLVMVSGVF